MHYSAMFCRGSFASQKTGLVEYYSFGSVSYSLVFLVCTIKKRRNHRRKKGRQGKQNKTTPPPLPCLSLRFGSANDSVIFSHCFAFSSYTYVVVTCAIILELCYYAGPVTSFLFFPWWSGRESNALARLLTLRLPSSSEPFSLSLTVLRLYP